MKLGYGVLVILVLGICIAGCTQPVENLTEEPGAPLGLGNETPTETPMETTPMETPTETATPMETTPMETPTETATPMETPAENETQYMVAIQDGSFDPPTLEVPPGSTVVWTNEGTMNQTVTGIGLETNFDSGLIAPGETFDWMFTAPGTYNYTSLTTGMSGNIIVGTAEETNQTA